MEKVAYITIDDKKMQLMIVQTRNGRYRVIEQVENFYDLTNDITKDCLLSLKSKADMLRILNLYRNTIKVYGVEKMVAVASNVIVKARNYRGFLDEIYTNTGMNFSILNDEEVTRYVYTSVLTKIDASKGVCFHVGAYSTNIFKFNRRNIVESVTINWGHRNLSLKEGTLEEKTALFKKELKKCKFLKTIEETQIIGCGTPFIDVSRLAKKLVRYPIAIDNNYDLTKEQQVKVGEFISGLDSQMVKKVKGLTCDGAENINGGYAIVSAIFDYLDFENIIASTANTLDGVALCNVNGVANEKYADLLQTSLDTFYEFRKEDLSINYQSFDMAIMIFKQLKVVHKLPRAYIKPLKIASYMFDCGRFVSFDDQEKHAFYVIMNSPIAGASQKDILIAAFACSCQNLDNFNLAEITKYKSILTDEDVDAIRKLGVLVRLSVSLNASRQNVITDIVCDILGDSIIMKTVVNSDPSYEIIQSMKLSEDFKKVFKKSLQII